MNKTHEEKNKRNEILYRKNHKEMMKFFKRKQNLSVEDKLRKKEAKHKKMIAEINEKALNLQRFMNILTITEQAKILAKREYR